MTTFWRFAPWLSRLPLLAVTLIFTRVSWRFLSDPVQAAAASSISLGSGAAITIARVGFGGFPLGFAIITLACLVSTHRLLTGLCFVVTMIAVVIAVRIMGILVDNSAHESLRVLVAEVILLTLSVISLFVELRRRGYRLQDAARKVPSG